MEIDSKNYRIAISQVAANVAIGLIPLILICFVIPGIQPSQTLNLWLCFGSTFVLSLATSFELPLQQFGGYFGFFRIASCLLLGSSLAAVFWKLQNLPHALEIIIFSFFTRWLLFALETRDLFLADIHRNPLPSIATRVRRTITFITGGVIPVMILIGLEPIPLLILSFILTALSQWAINYETMYRPPSRSQIIHDECRSSPR